MSINTLSRVFLYDNKEIPDPNSSFTEQEILKFLSGTYPSILNSKIEKREVKDDKLYITVSNVIGTKG